MKSSARRKQSTHDAAWAEQFFAPVDGASCVFFRVLFGGLMAKWAWDYLATGRVQAYYIEPKFHFTYYGFDWVQPWSGEGMVWHFIALILLSLCIASGFLYRVSSLLFALGFTYFFLLDRTNYQNHYYLIALLSWWLPWMPLNRDVSIDAYLWPGLRRQSVPAWTLWSLRFHVGIPYFFGGIAKFQPDWLLGEPLTTMLLAQKEMPILGPLIATDAAGLLLSWGGLVFDLAIVPLLLWKPTRALAYVACVPFHLMNSIVFNIHVFPWLMLGATTLFFEPDWPRKLLGGGRGTPASMTEVLRSGSVSFSRRLAVGLMLGYAAFHCIWPLRNYCYSGNSCWTERGHFFAWRMMLRGKKVVLGYAVRDKQTGAVSDGRIERFINREQSEKFGRDPEMILHLARFLAQQYLQETGREASVYALVLTSLNGRKPELMLDPNVDLASEPRGIYARTWVMPQTEPLRHEPWNVPIELWREYVELPELKFMSSAATLTTPPQAPLEHGDQRESFVPAGASK